MKEYKFNISITEECSLRCPHCYTRNKEGSLTPGEVETIIGNLEDGLTRVKIEGGEPYSEKELFYYTIRKFRERFPEADIRANSNGVAFYDSRESIIKEADMLYSLGVRRLRISLDKFHEDGGADLEKVASIKRILDEIGHPLETGYMSLTQALAIGNAEDLPEEQKERRDCMNHPECLDKPYFFTDIKGNLYTCCWRLIPPLGNLLKSKLKDLYDNMSEMQRRLLSGDVKFLASDKNLADVLSNWGECMLCKAVFYNEAK
ncbi:MAG: radical SAM protein [Candidatus Nanoarchaeia archaeon]|nr:radical SAM protein [Candidatus Nanoarchaeia archaeon]